MTENNIPKGLLGWEVQYAAEVFLCCGEVIGRVDALTPVDALNPLEVICTTCRKRQVPQIVFSRRAREPRQEEEEGNND